MATPNPAALMAALNGLGGNPPAPPPGASPGLLPGAAPGRPPGPTPPSALGAMPDKAILGLHALDRLASNEPSGGLALEKVGRALDLAQQLIVATLPLVSQWNAEVAKELHVIGRQIADTRINLSKENAPAPPPAELLMGVEGTGMPAVAP